MACTASADTRCDRCRTCDGSREEYTVGGRACVFVFNFSMCCYLPALVIAHHGWCAGVGVHEPCRRGVRHGHAVRRVGRVRVNTTYADTRPHLRPAARVHGAAGAVWSSSSENH